MTRKNKGDGLVPHSSAWKRRQRCCCCWPAVAVHWRR